MKKENAVTTRLIRCPRCRKSTRYNPSNPYRPFCGALCKNEDIIDWADQRFAIPGQALGEEDSVEEAHTTDKMIED